MRIKRTGYIQVPWCDSSRYDRSKHPKSKKDITKVMPERRRVVSIRAETDKFPGYSVLLPAVGVERTRVQRRKESFESWVEAGGIGNRARNDNGGNRRRG